MTYLGDITESAAASVDSAFRRSGDLNRLTEQGKNQLYVFPSDLGQPETGNGIIHWVEFIPHFLEAKGIQGVVKNIRAAVGSGLDALLPDSTDSEDNAERKQAQEDASNALGELGKSLNISDNRLAGSNRQAGESVSIYLPGGIEYTDAFSYEEVGFAAAQNIKNASAFQSTVALNLLRQLAGGLDIVGGILGQDSINAGDVLSAQLGVVVNPQKEQMFRGVAFRSFDFKFNLIPRSKKEAETVASIIKLFRFHAYPELSENKAFFNFPSEFEIKFKSYDVELNETKENTSLPKLKKCVLEKITTNYTPDDVYHSFKDGSPIRVEISLSFKETQYIHRELVKDGF